LAYPGELFWLINDFVDTPRKPRIGYAVQNHLPDGDLALLRLTPGFVVNRICEVLYVFIHPLTYHKTQSQQQNCDEPRDKSDNSTYNGPMHRYANRLVHALASPTAMWLSVVLTGYWIYNDPPTWYDALLAGGAMILAQAIFRAGEPRDKALHRKLDEIIHGSNADDAVAGSEID